jgi:hypothetical protein
MRTYDEIAASAREGSAFSNSTSFEIWAANRGCWTCRNDDDAAEKYCPILSVALATGKTPAEWLELSEDRVQDYTCTEYDERRDDGPDDDGPGPDAPPPSPVAELEGQIDIFEVFADQVVDASARTGVEAVAR